MAIPTCTETKQGLESQVGVYHIGHFYLTKLLLPAIQKADGRIVCLNRSVHLQHDIQTCLIPSTLDTDPYHKWTAYGNTKACNMLHAKALNSLPDITAYLVMPGSIHTGLQGPVDWYTKFQWAIVTPFFFKSIAQGAATSTAKLDKLPNGEYYNNCTRGEKALNRIQGTVAYLRPSK